MADPIKSLEKALENSKRINKANQDTKKENTNPDQTVKKDEKGL